jgi:hypothetical protein
MHFDSTDATTFVNSDQFAIAVEQLVVSIAAPMPELRLPSRLLKIAAYEAQ